MERRGTAEPANQEGRGAGSSLRARARELGRRVRRGPRPEATPPRPGLPAVNGGRASSARAGGVPAAAHAGTACGGQHVEPARGRWGTGQGRGGKPALAPLTPGAPSPLRRARRSREPGLSFALLENPGTVFTVCWGTVDSPPAGVKGNWLRGIGLKGEAARASRISKSDRKLLFYELQR